MTTSPDLYSGPERLYRFLMAQMRPYPGRLNLMMRTLLSCSLVIIISMALQVPFLALSLIVVFYVTQTNVVLTRMVGTLFILGVTLAIGLSILLLKFTYAYPLLRALGASTLFFFSVYLMRVTKIGVVFFIVGIVVIYVQTFADLTDQAELVLRLVMWVWVAVSYAILLTLLINTLLLPVEPARQLEDHLRGQLRVVAGRIDGTGSTADLSPENIQRSLLASQQLLRFINMRDSRFLTRHTAYFSRVGAISRLLVLASQLPAKSIITPEIENLRRAVLAVNVSMHTTRSHDGSQETPQLSVLSLPGAYEELQLALLQIQEGEFFDSIKAPAKESKSLFAADAFVNPAYVQFSLKTLFAALICYLFYTASDWQGIHTIMLTCLIVAQPTLGASAQRAYLRLGGALVGGFLALVAMIWVVPDIDGIVGLLFMVLPVMGLGAWIAAGSERVSYAGIQIIFTFSLALLEQFTPNTDLTDIRDRLIGVLLGVGISLVIHRYLWPEAEGQSLLNRLAKLISSVSGSLQINRSANKNSLDLNIWSELRDCEAMLARVALEPGWQTGESKQEVLIFHLQEILERIRSIVMASDALQVELAHARQPDQFASVLPEVLESAKGYLEKYAEILRKADFKRPDVEALKVLDSYAGTNANSSLLESRMRNLLLNIKLLPYSL
ncbi:Membrane fusion component MdtO of tripartite multidrug resistance system [Pseudomonas chlororaphis subsp. aureofaciens]|nr:FUSC family protein [Pseudomonas chlororaphis]TSD31295.1 FUSC family protein [Pseudomonas sp. ATCC 13985]AZD90917.1 Membrane fusion component MdtO of tripartite multidrug resistance system [Pseudomonas chlororaphis subsp. aureofaciens]KAB0529818.1 FUSC family protein [Pseudomonas chlororaphis subsp. aureofaciens]SDT42015.1 multidrug resistance protein MdtO [Pseudomonas chlororaphis]SUD23292.1 multidrug efflux system protein MdtO [Pseudomonas chlororaphis]